MAGDWIKMRGNLWDDPRVARLCDESGASEAAVIGALYWLWSSADQHSEDGVMPGLLLRSIDRKTGVPGIGAALVTVGWLADNPEGVRIVRFDEHNGASAKRRCMEAQRKANGRKLSAFDADTERTEEGQEPPNCGARDREEIEESTEAKASVVASKPATQECPHQEIIALYHEILPMCPSVREWTNGRSSNLKTRWREKAKRQDLAWWRRFFEFVSESEFLTGRGVATPGRDPFVADLGWLVKPENFAKVVEGKYHSQREAA